MKVVVGTKNHAKTAAVNNVFKQYFTEMDLVTESCHSGVSEQPIGNEETRQGAINRAVEALSCGGGDIGVGLEGGVIYVADDMYVCNWGAIALADGTTITAAGAQIPLPQVIKNEIEKGFELGPVIERHFNRQGIRQQEGAMGMFTNGVITRVKLFEHVMELLIGQYLYIESNNQHK
ncbi:MAG TPA: DUF84 family protein [Sporosarcina sp.]|nr:DUF84 family protein [Sporosarcina sp.]